MYISGNVPGPKEKFCDQILRNRRELIEKEFPIDGPFPTLEQEDPQKYSFIP
jgi:hypothetical protein